MQISWQAQRFVELEVQISYRNLGRASKPKSHPGNVYNIYVLNAYKKLKNLKIEVSSFFPNPY